MVAGLEGTRFGLLDVDTFQEAGDICTFLITMLRAACEDGSTHAWGKQLWTLCICVSVYILCVSPFPAQERIQQYFTQMRNVILQIKATQCLVLSLFMPFYFLLCWHGCTCWEALKDIIGVVKNYWEARTFPCSDPPLLFPICHHLMWQSFYRALRQRRLKVNTAIRKQLGGKCNTFHTKLNSSST